MAWTTPTTAPFLAGHEPTAAELATQVTNNFKALGDAWTSFTPTWTSSGTAVSLGNGVLSGVYMNTGKLCIARIFLTMGSTTTYGTGNYAFVMPFASTAGAQWVPLGGCTCRDASAGLTYGLQAFTAGTSSASGGNDSGGRLGQLVPFTWANTDTLALQLTFETA